MDPTPDPASVTATPPSRWALALQGDAQALSELAASYWYGVYVWWRRSGLEAEAAGTATAASFTRWFTTQPPSVDDCGAGLMREWLPARLAALAAEGWEVEGEPALAIEPQWAEQHYAGEPEGEPDAVFHRRWTLTVLEFAMQGLRAEYAARGLEALFVEASPFVGFDGADEERYAAASERTGMTVGAMRRAVFDFRTHHRDLLRSIVADTVADPADLGGEITALLCACDLAGAAETPAPLPTAIRTFKPDELLARAMNTVQMTSGGVGKWKPPSDAEVARLFPQYEMLGIIGYGGMGAVYRARQVALDREVAIKLLPLEVSADQAFSDRFVREARAMAKLSHPNIISVFDFGTTAEGHLFFVMEYVEGANVSQIIRGPGLAPAQALAITGQVCTALAYAHGRGVIHRDIKPANVMVDTEGTAKVADFGLARLDGADPEQYGQTAAGTIMGTAEYMSPEQKRGMAVDHRADIYSIGVMLYEMLCKEPPQGAFEPPSQRAGCDARLDQIVLKAMHRTPEGRYQSTTEMKMDLEAARTPLPAVPQHRKPAPRMNLAVGGQTKFPPPKKSPVGLIFGLLAAALALVGAAYFLNGDKQEKKPGAGSAAKASQTTAALAASRPEIFGPPIPADFKAPEAMPATVTPPEKPPMPPTQPLTGPKDLLAGVDVVRDAVHGEWKVTPEGLAVAKNGESEINKTELLGFNYAPPEEYDFEIEFTIQDGDREVSQVLPLAGRTVLWKMNSYGNEFYFGSTLDGKSPRTGGRTEALVRLPTMKLNQRYRSVVEVRRGSLRALLDGVEVLRWSGDFQRLGSEAIFSLPDPRQLGLAAFHTSVLFHKAEVRPPGIANLAAVPKKETKPQDTQAVAAAPGASALVAASNDPRLVKLESAFNTRFESDAQKPYLALVAALNQSYLTNGVARLRVAAQAKGSLDEITALDAEKAAIGRGEGVPAADDGGTPEALKIFRTSYRMAMAKYNADRAKTAGQLYDLYLGSLDGYVTELTRANKIEEAKKIKALREEVAGKKAALTQAGGADSSKAGTTVATAASDLRAPASGNIREAAKWLLTMGGKLTVAKGTLQSDVLAERDIPPGKFDIIGIALDKRDSKLPAPTDTDFQFLRGIKTLRTVFLNVNGYGDAALAFLADDVDLNSVHLSGPTNLTDGVLPHFGVGAKITDFALTSAGNFTGKGLRRMYWLPVLTTADFSGSGLTDEGLKELSAARRLQSLNLHETKVTPAGIEAFKKALPKCVVTE